MRKVLIASGVSGALADKPDMVSEQLLQVGDPLAGGLPTFNKAETVQEAPNAGAGAAFEKLVVMPEKLVVMPEKPTSTPEKPTVTPPKKGSLRGLGSAKDDEAKAKLIYHKQHEEDLAADQVGDQHKLTKGNEELIHQMVRGNPDMWTENGDWNSEAIDEMWKDMPEELRNMTSQEIQEKAKAIDSEELHSLFNTIHPGVKDMWAKLMDPNSEEAKQMKETLEPLKKMMNGCEESKGHVHSMIDDMHEKTKHMPFFNQIFGAMQGEDGENGEGKHWTDMVKESLEHASNMPDEHKEKMFDFDFLKQMGDRDFLKKVMGGAEL